MDRICIVDTSIPAYADPTARECFVMVGASAESLQLGLNQVVSMSQTAAYVNLFASMLIIVALVFWGSRGSR